MATSRGCAAANPRRRRRDGAQTKWPTLCGGSREATRERRRTAIGERSKGRARQVHRRSAGFVGFVVLVGEGAVQVGRRVAGPARSVGAKAVSAADGVAVRRVLSPPRVRRATSKRAAAVDEGRPSMAVSARTLIAHVAMSLQRRRRCESAGFELEGRVSAAFETARPVPGASGVGGVARYKRTTSCSRCHSAKPEGRREGDSPRDGPGRPVRRQRRRCSHATDGRRPTASPNPRGNPRTRADTHSGLNGRCCLCAPFSSGRRPSLSTSRHGA